MKKKLQVFVSSTWTDMILERQAAVEAILEAGHIPAGMELFSADNKKQFEVIKKWIRDSDVFILILGGRYGSRENGIGKSYIQREYEYAKRIGKKPIAIILSDKGIANKIAKGDYEISDAEYLQNDYKIFKSSIKNNKMCSFFDDLASLKNCVMNALRNCEENSNLLGWVRASDAIGDFTYPYVLENQEFCMEYISTTVIKYTKKLYIRMLADGIQYYTDRYSWNAGGTITKSLKNKNQLIVDEFSDGAFQAYTVRLEEASQKGSSFESTSATVTSITIKGTNIPTEIDLSTGAMTYSLDTKNIKLEFTTDNTIGGSTAPKNVIMINPSSSNIKADITIQNGEKVLTFTDIDITVTPQAGESHEIELTFEQQAVSGQASITEWTDGTGGTGTVK